MVEIIKGFFQVEDMVGFFEALGEHVIDVDFHISINLVFENLIHQVLVGDSCILQTKRHHFIVVNTFVDHDGDILLILGSHPDLVVSPEGIHKAK